MTHRYRALSGITLFDTLAILVVTALGSALLAAGVGAGGSRGDGMTAQDQENLHRIGQAAAAYRLDHDGWLVGSPSASGRELLNDGRAQTDGLALEVNGDATQPFDWAGPLAWTYLAPESPRPDRRDERFALLNGTPITDYMNPEFDPGDVDLMASGPLAVFADPANGAVSLPFAGNTEPNGIDGTAFQPQLATSYMIARDFLWWPEPEGGSQRPRWASKEFWGNLESAVWSEFNTNDVAIPNGGAFSIRPPYRPRIDQIGDPAMKIFFADGTRFQASGLVFIDHDTRATGSFGGAFADTGAWNVGFTRAYPMGLNAAGDDMEAQSFRHGVDEDGEKLGNVAFYDGAVQLMRLRDVRRPELWLPRHTAVSLGAIWEEIRDEYEVIGGQNGFGGKVLIP